MNISTGTQNDFLDVIKDLVEFEYNIREGYEEAAKKIGNENYRIKIEEFCQDHEHHIMELSKLLQSHNESQPTKPGMIQSLIIKSKVILAEAIGDQAILSAINSNENDTNLAYERINARHDRWDDSKEILKQALKDEKKHKKWLDETIK